jgi:hypothetical protein
MINKRGQGLSLNVIIVAAIALVVLVVLIAIFAGRAGDFDEKVSNEAKQELTVMKTFYGSCHPGALQEATFVTKYSLAIIEDTESDRLVGKSEAKAKLQTQSDKCRQLTDEDNCVNDGACAWS